VSGLVSLVTRRGGDVLDRGETGRRNGRAHLPASAARAHGPVADDPRDEAAEARIEVAYAERLVGDAVRRWHLSDRADPAAKKLADRHYNRQSPDSPQFVPPGRCIVLRTEEADAFWITSWPLAQHVRHAWPGAWVCSAFRNESPHLSSALIVEAVAATRAFWVPPALGMITFVDAAKTRRKRDPGRCFRRAGFEHVGYTKGGLYAFQLLPSAMPEPMRPSGAQTELTFA
jgi:hypothetical protein